MEGSRYSVRAHRRGLRPCDRGRRWDRRGTDRRSHCRRRRLRLRRCFRRRRGPRSPPTPMTSPESSFAYSIIYDEEAWERPTTERKNPHQSVRPRSNGSPCFHRTWANHDAAVGKLRIYDVAYLRDAMSIRSSTFQNRRKRPLFFAFQKFNIPKA